MSLSESPSLASQKPPSPSSATPSRSSFCAGLPLRVLLQRLDGADGPVSAHVDLSSLDVVFVSEAASGRDESAALTQPSASVPRRAL